MNHALTRPARITGRVLAGCILVLLAGGLFSDIWPFFLDNPTQAQRDLMLMWQLDAEYNPPTYFSTLMLFGNGLLLVGLGGRLARIDRIPGTDHAPGRHDGLIWATFGLLFMGLAVDEVVSIHERTGRFLGRLVGLGDNSWIMWVLPGIALVLVTFLAVRGALMRLPAIPRRRFLLAGLTYVMGAVGLEIIGTAIHYSIGWSPRYLVATYIEETLEMIGQAWFMVALVDLTARLGQVPPGNARP